MEKLYITEEKFNEYIEASSKELGKPVDEKTIQYAKVITEVINDAYKKGFDEGFEHSLVQLEGILDRNPKAEQVNRNA